MSDANAVHIICTGPRRERRERDQQVPAAEVGRRAGIGSCRLELVAEGEVIVIIAIVTVVAIVTSGDGTRAGHGRRGGT